MEGIEDWPGGTMMSWLLSMGEEALEGCSGVMTVEYTRAGVAKGSSFAFTYLEIFFFEFLEFFF